VRSGRWADRTGQPLFEALTVLEKLAELIPRPPINLVLYHVLALLAAGGQDRLPEEDGARGVAAMAARPHRPLTSA
jgi:hypothetical protein